jgi:multimeric flavodoxin WrbA
LEKKCVIDKDIVNESIEKILEADGIILASPTYFADLTPELKALIDRADLLPKPMAICSSTKWELLSLP